MSTHRADRIPALKQTSGLRDILAILSPAEVVLLVVGSGQNDLCCSLVTMSQFLVRWYCSDGWR